MSMENLQEYVLARQLHLLNTHMNEHEQQVKWLTEVILSSEASCENNKWASTSHLLLKTNNNNALETLKSVLLQRLSQAQNVQNEDNTEGDNVWTTSKSELFSIVEQIVRFCEFDKEHNVNDEDDISKSTKEDNEEETNDEQELDEKQSSNTAFSQNKVFYLPSSYDNSAQDNMNTSKTNLKVHREMLLPSTHKVFIRMLHSQQLNEESLNTYFGRYGQVTVQLLSRQRLTDWVQTINNNINNKSNYETPNSSSSSSFSLDKNIARCVVDAYAALFESVPVHKLWMQDFVITLDSALNVQLALSRAYYKELLFIALHSDHHTYNEDDKSGNNNELNCYTVDNLNVVLLSTLPVVKMQSHIADVNLMGIGKDRSSKLENMKRKVHKRENRRSLSALKIKRKKGLTTHNEEKELEEEMYENDGYEEEYDDEEDEDEIEDFVPDIVIDNFPYWTTEDQIKVFLQELGIITHLHLSIDDLSGIFTGAVMVRMQSLQEALELAKRVHLHHYMNEAVLRAGVLTPELELQDVLSGEVLWSAQIQMDERKNSTKDDNESVLVKTNKQSKRQKNEHTRPKLSVNERLWV